MDILLPYPTSIKTHTVVPTHDEAVCKSYAVRVFQIQDCLQGFEGNDQGLGIQSLLSEHGSSHGSFG